MYTKIGPWGGEGGSAWDDEHIGGIRQIVIQHESLIYSIQIGYDVQGTLVWGDSHGRNGGSRTMINLKYPEEFLVGVSGSWGGLQHFPDVIRSLTFQTNKRTFGPYGEQQGMPFSYSTMGGKIVGFYGRSGDLLDTIGVHSNPPRATSCLDLLLPASCFSCSCETSRRNCC